MSTQLKPLTLANKTSGLVRAIIKVKEANYVPKYVRVRAAISPYIFTGEFIYENLESLKQDPKIESVSISKNLKSSE